MKTRLHSSRFYVYTLLGGALLLASLACSLSGLTNKVTTFDITLTQDQVNSIFQKIRVQDPLQGGLLARVDRVEMQNGYIRVFGAAAGKDGTEATGSFDVSVGAENNALTVRIIRVNFPGIDLNDPRIAQVNQQLQAALSQSVADTNGKVLVRSAVVKDGVLKISVQLNVQ